MQAHKTTEFITKYEYTKALIVRAAELRSGKPPLIETDFIDVIEIAKLEISARLLKYDVIRNLPDGDTDIWDIRDMHIRDH